MIIVDLLKAFAENNTADKKRLEKQREIKKELEAKRQRLGYTVGFFMPIRRKRYKLYSILAVVMLMIFYCEICILSITDDKFANNKVVFVSIAIPICICLCLLAYILTALDNTTSLLITLEQETYAICEYIFIHDKLSDEEDKLYIYFTQYRVRNGRVHRREFSKMLKSIKL